MTGPQGAGVFACGLSIPGHPGGGGAPDPVFTEAFCDTFDRADGGLGGSWDAQYINTTWGLNHIGGSTFIAIVSNTAQHANTNPTVAVRVAGVASRNAYGSAKNLLDTTDRVATRNCRVMINVGRNGATTGSYYAVAWGTQPSIGEGYLSIRKFANNVDNVLATRRYNVPVNSIVRIRHDGAGLLVVDVDGEDVLYAYDQIESENGVWLRALGVGFGLNSNSGSVFLDQVCFGTVDSIVIPDPYNWGDMFDADSFASGNWTASGTGRPTLAVGFKSAWAMQESGSGTSTTWKGTLNPTETLTADQYIEADMEPDSSVRDCYLNLRANAALTEGYYARWEAANTQWEIGKHGTGVIGLLDAASPGNHRVRFTAVGTSLSLYQWTATGWALKVQVTDSTWTSPGQIIIAFNDVFSQGIPRLHNVSAGNYEAMTAPTVTINQALGQTDPVYGTVLFDIQFSEPVLGFVAADITISGTAGGTPYKYLTGSGAFYQLAVSNFTSNGTVIADIAAGVVTGLLSGLANVASTSDDNTVNWAITGVTKPFTVAWNQAAGPNFPTLGDGVDIVSSGTRRIISLVVSSRTGSGGNLTNAYSPFSAVHLGSGSPQLNFAFRTWLSFRNDLINFSDANHAGVGNKDLGWQTPFSDGSSSGLCLLLDSGWTVGQIKQGPTFASTQRPSLAFDTPIAAGAYVVFFLGGNSDYIMAQAPELAEPIGTNLNSGARTTQIHVWGSGAMAGLTTWAPMFTGLHTTGMMGIELLPP